MGADATTLTVDMPAIRTVKYFFTAVPMGPRQRGRCCLDELHHRPRIADNSNDNDGTGPSATLAMTPHQRSNLDLGPHRWRCHRGVHRRSIHPLRGDGEGGEGKDWDY